MLNFESSRSRRFLLAAVATLLLAGVSGAESPEVRSAGRLIAAPRSRALRLGLPVDTPSKLLNERTVPDLDRPIVQFENVFWEPRDTRSLRRLIRETPLVRDKVVLEIGTGTGLLALCCLKAGARKVVATDVNPSAIANAAYNAELLQVDKRLETRWVQVEDCEAFSVIAKSERFDVIISNPPWENDAPLHITEYALYDSGFALQRSLLKDLDQHLSPDGKALLAYGCVDGIKSLLRLAHQHGLSTRKLDERKLDELPQLFLPGMLLEVAPARQAKEPK